MLATGCNYKCIAVGPKGCSSNMFSLIESAASILKHRIKLLIQPIVIVFRSILEGTVSFMFHNIVAETTAAVRTLILRCDPSSATSGIAYKIDRDIYGVR